MRKNNEGSHFGYNYENSASDLHHFRTVGGEVERGRIRLKTDPEDRWVERTKTGLGAP